MNSNSIKTKLVALIIATLGLGGAAIVATLRVTFEQDARLVAEQSVAQSIAAFRTLAENEERLLASTLEALAQDRAMIAAFATADREALLAQTQGLYATLKTRAGVTNWSFTGVDGTTFLRLSDPSYFGEKVDRPTVVKCLATRATQTGFAVGSQGFALRSARPLFDGERFLGCVEMGSEINRFVATMKIQTGSDYALFLTKDGIDPAKWARGRELLKLKDNWGEHPELVVAANTSADERIMRLQSSLASLEEKGSVLDVQELGERTYSRGVFPIADAAGKRAAAIFVLNDISRQASSMRHTQLVAVSIVVAMMVLASLLLMAMFERLIFVRLAAIIRVATRVVGGDFETKIPVNGNDEIGRFEELFEQFRQVFLSVLEEAHARAPSEPAPPQKDQAA